MGVSITSMKEFYTKIGFSIQPLKFTLAHVQLNNEKEDYVRTDLKNISLGAGRMKQFCVVDEEAELKQLCQRSERYLCRIFRWREGANEVVNYVITYICLHSHSL